MQSVLLQLRLRGLLPKRIRAVELFGMHGLWHTMDYVPLVEQLDFFEIDKAYLDLARNNLHPFPVTFHCADSIAWLRTTTERYDLVVADIPFSGPFYRDNGLPRFISDLYKATLNGGVLIVNCHARFLANSDQLASAFEAAAEGRTIRDIFFVPRNSSVTYVVISLAPNSQ